MELEFKAGQKVWIMKSNQPVETRIRSVQYTESLEVSKDAASGKETESVNAVCVYGTFADVHTPLSASKIGISREDLIQKLFSDLKTSPTSSVSDKKAPVKDKANQ